MPSNISVFIIVQLGIMLIMCLTMLPIMRKLHLMLQSEIRKLPMRSNPREAARYFAASRARLIFSLNRTLIFILLLAFVAVFFLNFYNISNNTPSATIYDAFPISDTISILYSILIAYIGSVSIFNMILASEIDVEAGRVFETSHLTRADVIAQKRRLFFIQILPTLLILESAELLFVFEPNMGLNLIILLAVAVIIFTLRHVFANQLLRVNYFLTPIEQTDWAHLKPRIQAWANLAGIKLGSIEVQHELIGSTNMRVSGLFNPVFILTENLLRNTEWRQQDALIAITLGIIYKGLTRKIFLRLMLRVLLSGIFAAYIFLEFFFRLSFLPIWLALVIPVAYLVLLRVVLRLFNTRKDFFVIDRFAATLTGDPMAIMVALHSIAALNGVPLSRKGASQPSAEERLSHLDKLARQDEPRAPQAGLLVPAITPARFGPYQLSTPFDEATPAGSVPEVPYGKLL